jgi:hypothetical protein
VLVVLHWGAASAQERQPPADTAPAPAAQESAPQPSSEAAPGAPTEKAEPAATDSLSDLLEEEDHTPSVGSFGYRLRRYGINSYIHGVITADMLQWQKDANVGFELRDAHVYFGADILDLIIPEVFLEFEPRREVELNLSELRIRYAQLDLRLYRDLLVLRTGIFLTPFGTYNTHTYPRFITKLPVRPTFFRKVVPTSWQEVGLQLFGSWEWAPERSLGYMVYVTNGLEQRDIDDPANPDDGVDEGGDLDDFETAFEEDRNNSKSLGARIQGELISGLTLGLSGYTGAYTADGGRRLNMFGVDASFYRGALSVEVEAAYSRQGVTGGALGKWGYFALVAYRVHPRVEPVLAVDQVWLDGAPEDDQRTYWAGLNLYPFPDEVPTALAKAIYSASAHRAGGAVDQNFTLQLAVGF